MPEISIIVPVYKVEQYLSRCVDSILAQTFRDFELILVDDGSPDRCGEICDHYARTDCRIKVIHKENGGLSDARNVGLDVACGRYIGFVDSDDYIEADMYEMMYKDIIDYDADIATCGIYQCYPKQKIKRNKHNICKLVNREEAIEIIFVGKLHSVTAWNKLYKKDVFFNVRYPMNCISEDAFSILDILNNASKIVINTHQKYYYVHRISSITTRAFTENDYDVIEAYGKNLKTIKDSYPRLLLVGYYRFWWAHFHLFSRIAINTKENRKNLSKDILFVRGMIRKNLFCIIKNPYQSFGRRIAYLLIALVPDFYLAFFHWWFFYVRSLH